MARLQTRDPKAAMRLLDELATQGTWSDRTMGPIWMNAKRQRKDAEDGLPFAAGETLRNQITAQMAEWDKVIARIESHFSPGGLRESEAAWRLELSRGEADDGDDEDGPRRGRPRRGVPGGPPAVPRTLVAILTKVFARQVDGREVKFEALAPQTRALYPMIWRMSHADRMEFIRQTRKTELAESPDTTEIDKSMISAWFMELFKKSYENTRKPETIFFSRSYLNPTLVSARGQLVLLTAIDYFFPGGRYSGGISSTLTLSKPDWTRLQIFTTLLADKFRNPPAASAAAAAAEEEDLDIGERRRMRVDKPSPLSSSSSLTRPVPSLSGRRKTPATVEGDTPPLPPSEPAAAPAAPRKAARLVVPPQIHIVPEHVQGVLAPAQLDGVSVSIASVAAAIYGQRLAAAIEPWMVSNTRKPPSSLTPQLGSATLENPADVDAPEKRQATPEQQVVIEEEAALTQLRADYDKYTRAKKALYAVIDVQRQSRRLLMTEDGYTALKGRISTIDENFMGLYHAKADLLDYLNEQLTGNRPRPVTSNHIIASGEPGTGKTTLMSDFAYTMMSLQLIDAPSLEAYSSVGETLRQNMTAAEFDKVTESTLPDGVPRNVADFIGKPALFALQAAVANSSGTLQERPTITDPGKFQSVYTGGIVANFLQTVLRSLGSALIIDEAYDLRAKEYGAMVTQLVALITQLGTEWSSVLLGYEEDMRNLVEVVNPGLQGRYRKTVRFGHYTAIEIVAILAQQISQTDNLTLAEKEQDVYAIARNSTARSEEVQQHMDKILTKLYDNVAPFAMRGSRRAANMFGSSNVRGVQKLLSEIGTTYTKEFTGEPTLRLVLPDQAGAAIQAARDANRPFGTWPVSRNPAQDGSDAMQAFRPQDRA